MNNKIFMQTTKYLCGQRNIYLDNEMFMRTTKYLCGRRNIYADDEIFMWTTKYLCGWQNIYAGNVNLCANNVTLCENVNVYVKNINIYVAASMFTQRCKCLRGGINVYADDQIYKKHFCGIFDTPSVKKSFFIKK